MTRREALLQGYLTPQQLSDLAESGTGATVTVHSLDGIVTPEVVVRSGHYGDADVLVSLRELST